MDKTNNTALDDPEPQRYYDWMLWKMRQEKAKEPVVMTTEEMMKKEIADMQSSIHHLQIRVKELVEENEKLKSQIGDWKNSLWGSDYRQRFHT
jgi:predicted RNase H-like nuclease (RuvC/YqgF family)